MSHYQRNLYGFCIDSRAIRSVTGANQEKFYRELTTFPSRVVVSTTKYRFRTSLAKGRGLMNLRFPLLNRLILDFRAELPDEVVPLLVALDVMQELKLFLHFHEIVVRSGLFMGYLSITYKQGHAYVRIERISNLYTRPYLTRLQLHFSTIGRTSYLSCYTEQILKSNRKGKKSFYLR